MQSRSKPFSAGNLRGIVYDFDAAGDGIPMHVHDEETCHITIVTIGSVLVSGDGWKQTHKSGAVIPFTPGQRHEIEALEPGTRIVNVMLT